MLSQMAECLLQLDNLLLFTHTHSLTHFSLVTLHHSLGFLHIFLAVVNNTPVNAEVQRSLQDTVFTRLYTQRWDCWIMLIFEETLYWFP